MFKKIPVISIDRLLIEKTRSVAVFKAAFDWDDLGSWDAVRRIGRDTNGNMIQAEGVFDDVKNSVVISSPGNRIAVPGLRDIVIVQRGKDLLVCRMDCVQKVSKLKKRHNFNWAKALRLRKVVFANVMLTFPESSVW